MASAIEHPAHYADNGPLCPHCGNVIECITVAEWVGGGDFSLGNVVKYIWRLGVKGGPQKIREDLGKARQYLDFRLAKEDRLEREIRAQQG